MTINCCSLFLFLCTTVFSIEYAHAAERGYPTIAQAGFHHNGLLYIDGDHSPEQLTFWLTGSFQSLDSRDVVFDTITLIVERTPIGSSTAYSTNEQDWTWILQEKLSGSNGILSNISRALTQLKSIEKKLQIVVMLPYVDPIGQQTFSPQLNFSRQNDRQQAIEWYIDTVIAAMEQYPQLALWGIYLMREDIALGIDEQITNDISQIVHQRQLRLLWIPYSMASSWNNWFNLGIDVAILQPGYAFSSPLMQGTFNAGRLRATAKLAYEYGLGVEIEASQGAGTDYELALLQNYLAQGALDGYQDVPTAYFLGNYSTIAQTKRACDLIRNYTAGFRIEPTFALNTKWMWTKNGTHLQATISISSTITPTAIRINWSPNEKAWYGRIVVEGLIQTIDNSTWILLSSSEKGEISWRDEDWSSTLLPFSSLSSQVLRSLRVSFIGRDFSLALTDDDLIIEQIPNGVPLQTSTGAPYCLLPSMFSYNPSYGDSTTQTLTNFARGLLTNGQWSTGEWQPTMSIGWQDDAYHHSYIRIALDFGTSTHIDQVVIRAHGGSYAGINWPNTARLLLSNDCVPFSSHSSSDCIVQSYPSTDRNVTGGTNTNQGGTLVFTISTSLRWTTLEFQPNGWFMIDEIQAFTNGQDLSHLIQYILLSPPTSSASSPLPYPDNGYRLTDGLIAGMMGPITDWTKSDSHNITIDLLVTRLIRQASVWVLLKPDWSISAPSSLLVSTSVDGQTWTSFGKQAQVQVGERILDAQRLFITNNEAVITRYVKFDFPTDPSFPGWWTMVSEVVATD